MPTLDDLFGSHAELRGAVMFARRRIRQLGGDGDPALPLLERVLEQSWTTAKAFQERLTANDRPLDDEGSFDDLPKEERRTFLGETLTSKSEQ